MKVQCRHCLPKEGLEIPDFKQSEKNNLLLLTLQSPVRSIKCLVDHFRLSHGDAKYIVSHINEKYGHCKRCNFDSLKEEYINCPKCGSLNFNWKHS